MSRFYTDRSIWLHWFTDCPLRCGQAWLPGGLLEMHPVAFHAPLVLLGRARGVPISISADGRIRDVDRRRNVMSREGESPEMAIFETRHRRRSPGLGPPVRGDREGTSRGSPYPGYNGPEPLQPPVRPTARRQDLLLTGACCRRSPERRPANGRTRAPRCLRSHCCSLSGRGGRIKNSATGPRADHRDRSLR